MIPSLGKTGVVVGLTCHNIVFVKTDGESRTWAWRMWAVEKIDMSKKNRQTKETKAAYLKAEKVMVRGNERFRITGWDKVLEEKELPTKYMAGFPRFVSYDSGRICLETENQPIRGFPCDDRWEGIRKYWIRMDVTTLTPDGFGNLLITMKEAGERLMEINCDIKKREENWIEPEKEYMI